MIHILIIPALLLSCYLLILAPNGGWLTMSPDILTTGASRDSSPHLLHFSHNAFLAWELDPLFSLFSLEAEASKFLLFLLFFVGLFALQLELSKGKDVYWHLGSAALTGCCLLLLYQWDTVVLAFLAWLPLSILFVYKSCTINRGILPVLILTLFLGLRLARTANHTSLAVLLLCAGVSLSLLSVRNSRNHFSLPRATIPLWLLSMLVLSIPTFILLWSIPSTILPDYPPLAHLVPDDGIPGQVTPLVTSYLSPPVIDRPFIKALFGRASMVLLFLSMIMAFFQRSQQLAQRLVPISFVLASILAFDVLLPEDLAQIAPLATLGRNLSLLNYFPLASLTCAAGIFVLLLQSALHPARIYFYVCLLFLLLAPYSQGIHAYSLRSQWGALQRGDYGSALYDFDRVMPQAQVAPEEREFMKARLLSPSYQLIQRVGIQSAFEQGDEMSLWPLTGAARVMNMKFVPIARYNVQMTSSHSSHQQELGRLADRAKQTRWSPGRGIQDGSEWLHLRFPSPIRMDGIYLNTGNYVSDFPRALEVAVLPNCESEFTSDKTYDVLARFNPWLGPIRFTERGYPFYGNQADVRVPFAKTTLVQCLLLRQLGEAPYDWSISELRIAAAEAKVPAPVMGPLQLSDLSKAETYSE